VKKLIFSSIAATLLLSCASRATMSEGHGRAYRAAFRAQAVNRDAKSAALEKPLAGLDPDEARIVYENYSRSLAPKEAQQQKKKSSVIVVEDDDERKRTPKE
jgi:hypothetical protein